MRRIKLKLGSDDSYHFSVSSQVFSNIYNDISAQDVRDAVSRRGGVGLN